jgi:NADPH2:quinone reductase
MKAAINTRGENGNTLTIQDVPDPIAGPNEILIGVKAVGLNRADLSRGISNPDKPTANIAGIEMTGDVIAVGPGVTNFAVGDRVMSMAGKSYAEKCVADASVAMKIPGGLDYVAAAAIPTFFSTAHDAIVTNGEFRKGDAVLIQGVTAGVGIAMVQVAKAMGASVVAGTSRDAEKLSRIKHFGLDIGIRSGHDKTADVCMEATAKRGMNVIIDNVGKGVLADSLDAAAIKGRIVSVGRLGGKMDEIDLDKLALKRLKLIGVTFRTRSAEEKAEITRRLVADLGYLFVSGAIHPPVDRTFAFDEALAAQEYMRSNKHIGKIVLTL